MSDVLSEEEFAILASALENGPDGELTPEGHRLSAIGRGVRSHDRALRAQLADLQVELVEATALSDHWHEDRLALDAARAEIDRLREGLERIATHPRTHDKVACSSPPTCIEEAGRVARAALAGPDPGGAE